MREPSTLEEAITLRRDQRAIPWVYLVLAVVCVLIGATVLFVGCMVMSQLARMENQAHQRAMAFAWQSDQIARIVVNR